MMSRTRCRGLTATSGIWNTIYPSVTGGERANFDDRLFSIRVAGVGWIARIVLHLRRRAYRRHQSLGVIVLRVVDDLQSRAPLHDETIEHHDDSVGDLCHHRKIVGDMSSVD